MESEKWKVQIEGMAHEFSMRMREDFVKTIAGSRQFLPRVVVSDKLHLENQVYHMDTFIDYLTASAVGIACTYVSANKEFEELFVSVVREKFKEMRARAKQGDLS